MPKMLKPLQTNFVIRVARRRSRMAVSESSSGISYHGAMCICPDRIKKAGTNSPLAEIASMAVADSLFSGIPK